MVLSALSAELKPVILVKNELRNIAGGIGWLGECYTSRIDRLSSRLLLRPPFTERNYQFHGSTADQSVCRDSFSGQHTTPPYWLGSIAGFQSVKVQAVWMFPLQKPSLRFYDLAAEVESTKSVTRTNTI